MMHRFITFTIFCTLFIHNTNILAFQAKDISLHSKDSLIISLQKELRTPYYKKEILPNDFSHLSDLIAFGISTHQTSEYVRSLVKLFSNMLKSSHYVNASAFSYLLETLPRQLTPYFEFSLSREYITNSALYDATFVDRFNATIYRVLYSTFSKDYESFRQNPDLFLKNITANIVTIAHEEIVQEQLRQGIIRLCEIALSKLIWNPATHEETWFITKKIAEQLVTFLKYNVIDDTNDIDDLHWTLLNRYCYFIELTATDMPKSFYKAVRQDLLSDNIVLFALKEQDSIVEPKLSYMQRTLLEAETASYYHQPELF
ncbi:MAG TPA: hypothetical protein VLB80_05015 [Candidatus Babeliales bacterium]|nr:hypothetical protein [Candidatus Babeliales bacterium]